MDCNVQHPSGWTFLLEKDRLERSSIHKIKTSATIVYRYGICDDVYIYVHKENLYLNAIMFTFISYRSVWQHIRVSLVNLISINAAAQDMTNISP